MNAPQPLGDKIAEHAGALLAADLADIEHWDTQGGKWEKWPIPVVPIWSDYLHYYRVKPEKKVMYVNVYPDSISHTSRAIADSTGSRRRAACIRVEYTEGQFDE